MKAESQFVDFFLNIFGSFIKFSWNILEIARICIWSKYKIIFSFFLWWQLFNKTYFFFHKNKLVWKFSNTEHICNFFQKCNFCGQKFGGNFVTKQRKFCGISPRKKHKTLSEFGDNTAWFLLIFFAN